MKHLLLILFVISSIWGQSLNFINKDSAIIIKPGQLVNLNGTRYTLVNTDYDKQQIILEIEIPDSAPYKYLREPIEGGFFFVSILKIPIYKYIKNTKFQKQDYEKSTKSFFFNQVKGTAIGALSGFAVGSFEGGFHWGLLGGIIWGGAGMINGSIHGLLIPRESGRLILSDQAWQIIK